nr:SH3 domain-containing protein [Blautia massiliensis (ex Durand et al. 2017)]
MNLRAGAGTGKSILAVMKNGEKVQCYGYYNDCNGVKWLYVVYKNIVGYASSKYLSK